MEAISVDEQTKRLQDIALQLLQMYQTEREKQIVAMRMAAGSAYERDAAKIKQEMLWKEIASIKAEILRE